ncbi:MAG: DUF1361 domain-containing protein [Bacteroidia bacterium]
MLLGTAFAMGLLIFRVYLSGSLEFVFLSWNLFLAWIPWLIAAALVRYDQMPWLLVGGAALWLLFFPNAPYIVTDLFHLRPRNGVPQWYDLILIVSFAWTGLLLGLSSLRDMQRLLFDRLGRYWSGLVATAILFLSAFGVYLGRYGRWNSWDLFTRPHVLLGDVVDPVFAPGENLGVVGFTLCFGGLLLLLFLTFAGWNQPRES